MIYPNMLTDNQRRLLETLREAITNGESLSMQDMADKIQVDSPNTVLYHLRKLEERGLIVRNEAGKVVRVNSLNETSGAISFLPLLGSARCGLPLEQIEADITERMLPVPLRLLGQNIQEKLYLIYAIGDSMSPRIQDSDIVIFRPDSHPVPGNIVIARTEEGAVIKRYRETIDQVILESENPNYSPLVFDKNQMGEQLNIDGIAVGLFKTQVNLEGRVING